VRPTCASSSATTTWCQSREPAASETRCATRATSSRSCASAGRPRPLRPPPRPLRLADRRHAARPLRHRLHAAHARLPQPRLQPHPRRSGANLRRAPRPPRPAAKPGRLPTRLATRTLRPPRQPIRPRPTRNLAGGGRDDNTPVVTQAGEETTAALGGGVERSAADARSVDQRRARALPGSVRRRSRYSWTRGACAHRGSRRPGKLTNFVVPNLLGGRSEGERVDGQAPCPIALW
jgi:hypothetical protein